MQKRKDYFLPVSILIAAVLISGSLIYTAGNDGGNSVAPEEGNGALDNIIPVGSDDYILGDPNAEIFIVEYSDFECPFCKSFHITLQRIMDEYGQSGEVAWVYRHFPVHQKAGIEAQGAECAGKLGGNEGFWNYVNTLFERTELNDQTDLSILPEIAGEIGLNVSEFEACLESGEFDSKIIAQAQNAVATGGEGTPWSIVVTRDGDMYPVNGAQPYPAMKQLIDGILSE